MTSCHFLSSALSPFSEHPKNVKDGSRHHSEHFLGDWCTPFQTTQELGDSWQSSIPVMVTEGLFNQGLSFRMFCNRNLHFFKKQKNPKLNSFTVPVSCSYKHSPILLQIPNHMPLHSSWSTSWHRTEVSARLDKHEESIDANTNSPRWSGKWTHHGTTWENWRHTPMAWVISHSRYRGKRIEVIHDMTEMIHDVFCTN